MAHTRVHKHTKTHSHTHAYTHTHAHTRTQIYTPTRTGDVQWWFIANRFPKAYLCGNNNYFNKNWVPVSFFSSSFIPLTASLLLYSFYFCWKLAFKFIHINYVAYFSLPFSFLPCVCARRQLAFDPSHWTAQLQQHATDECGRSVRPWYLPCAKLERVHWLRALCRGKLVFCYMVCYNWYLPQRACFAIFLCAFTPSFYVHLLRNFVHYITWYFHSLFSFLTNHHLKG